MLLLVGRIWPMLLDGWMAADPLIIGVYPAILLADLVREIRSEG